MSIIAASKTTRLGTKRICRSCGARFYDFDKPSPTCPKCKAVFDVNAEPVLPPLEPLTPEELEAEREEAERMRLEKKGRPAHADDGPDESGADDDE